MAIAAHADDKGLLMTDDTETGITEAKHISATLPAVLDKAKPHKLAIDSKALPDSPYAKKDRSNGGGARIKEHACKPGEVRNPKGNGKGLAEWRANGGVASIRKVRSLYAKEGFKPEDVAQRMTSWLNMPYGRAKKKMNDDKTQLFERLGISILVHATDTGDTSRLDRVLDRIIGPVIQRTEADIRTLSVNAKADVDLLTRIQTDLREGNGITLDNSNG